jgi:hypothetical protein
MRHIERRQKGQRSKLGPAIRQRIMDTYVSLAWTVTSCIGNLECWNHAYKQLAVSLSITKTAFFLKFALREAILSLAGCCSSLPPLEPQIEFQLHMPDVFQDHGTHTDTPPRLRNQHGLDPVEELLEPGPRFLMHAARLCSCEHLCQTLLDTLASPLGQVRVDL